MRISETLAKLAANRLPIQPATRAPNRLTPLTGFGSNPGALAAWRHVPATLAPGAPLVVVLHGCTQTAAGYDTGTGWSTLADRAGFAVLFPEQSRSNNMNLCFNWFESLDVVRSGGEAESIAQIVAAMIAEHGLDRDRVYVTGLSAGGAMTTVMLATYPEMFAGGAIIGGLPYGGAPGVSAALGRMAGREDRGTAALIDSVARVAGTPAGRIPTVSIWHGGADPTVAVANADHLAAQWRGVHGAGAVPAAVEHGKGWEHQRWTRDGRVVVETWRIAAMGHGVPIDPAGPDRLGAVGPYMLDAGIDSTAAIARSWGIVPATVTKAEPAKTATRPTPRTPPPRPPVAAGVQKVIEDAMRAAGLMK
ncbi:extracellular catalytic domain type 1 short-chain-length polyhydroxyalkanoate depolymerase [Sphingomonas sp. Tas61C01]|uniref:extracellular catalytic domain type 1 short-chain-length polyhydroxyalkanoate depolymerase n=1 Tax=Sphingomonas sp. Tas61C01 TaxID=3458297 RepID=UPI00403E6FBF